MDIKKTTIEEFLKTASSSTPTPGGGAIAGVGGALASSMALMAANFTVGKKKFRDVEPEVKDLIGELEHLQNELLRLSSLDMQAYSGLSSAFKMPRKTDAEKNARKASIASAALTAVDPPDRILDCSLSGLQVCSRLASIANPNLKSDVAVAARFFLAAAQAAAENVEINLPLLDREYSEPLSSKTTSRIEEARRLHDETIENTH